MRLRPVDLEWRLDAECRFANPALFECPTRRPGPGAYEVAHRYCRRCPVRVECGAECGDDDSGVIRGGMWRWKPAKGGDLHLVDLLAIPDQDVA